MNQGAACLMPAAPWFSVKTIFPVSGGYDTEWQIPLKIPVVSSRL